MGNAFSRDERYLIGGASYLKDFTGPFTIILELQAVLKGRILPISFSRFKSVSKRQTMFKRKQILAALSNCEKSICMGLDQVDKTMNGILTSVFLYCILMNFRAKYEK